MITLLLAGRPSSHSIKHARWLGVTTTSQAACSSRGSATIKAGCPPTRDASTSGTPCRMWSLTVPIRPCSSLMCEYPNCVESYIYNSDNGSNINLYSSIFQFKWYKLVLCVPSILELFQHWYQYRNNTKNAGIGKYASLCTNHTPCNSLVVKRYPAAFQLAQLALTDVAYLKSIFLCCSKTLFKRFSVLPLATTIFKSDEEETGEPTELTKRLHLTIFYTLKSKEMCKELFF